MSEKVKNKAKPNDRNDNKHFEKLLKASLILGIIIVSGFIIYYILTPEPGYVNFGVLNSDKEAEDFPTTAHVMEDIEFFITVENYLYQDFIFRIKILKGDDNTKLGSTGSQGATSVFITSQITLNSNTKWISPKLHVSFSQVGSNQIIIVELWQITENGNEEFFDILWMRININ